MIAALALALTLAAAQEGARDYSGLSPAEAALEIQSHLAYAMMETYQGEASAEGRYLYLQGDFLTVIQRGVQEPTGEQVGGWYMTSKGMRRDELGPVGATLNPDRSSITLHFQCADPQFECVMATAAHQMFGGPMEDHGASEYSIELRVIYPEPAYEAELEQLFEIWRTGAPASP